MKRALSALVLLVFFSSCALCGEFLMNDTGETVYGLRVVFSEPVTITAFGDALTLVEPIGEASVFIFSGGALESWGSHWFNWEPSSAELVNQEWLATPPSVEIPEEGLTREDLLNLGRPPTYEEIMSAIAVYPGDDEPLYEPGPDEAIWLTDLEGHADIYDNDSIRINYADWFDRSQIIGVEVYRNGIKMEFLPNMLDVVTNEQMKTFDGNLSERSPASDHTDHAIFGYMFEVDVQTLDETHSCSARAKAAARVSLADGLHFVNHLGWWHELEDLGQDGLLEFYEEIAEAGWDGVQLDYWLFIDTPFGTDVRSEHECNNETGDWRRTPTPSELALVLDTIRETGLRAGIRVIVGVDNSYAYDTGERAYSFELDPVSVDSLFEDLSTEVVGMAQVAEQHGAFMITALTEMNTIEEYGRLIRRYLSDIDSVFSGMLAVNQATHHYIMDANAGEINLWDHLDRATFWDWVSEEGNPLIIMPNNLDLRMATSTDPSLSALIAEEVRTWSSIIDYYRTKYPGHPIMYGETGTYTTNGASAKINTHTMDIQEQADALSAIAISAEFLGLDGSSFNYYSAGEQNSTRVIESASKYALDELIGQAGDYARTSGSQTWGKPGSDLGSISVTSDRENLQVELTLSSEGLTTGNYAYEFIFQFGEGEMFALVVLDPSMRSGYAEYRDQTDRKLWSDSLEAAYWSVSSTELVLSVPTTSFERHVFWDDLCGAEFYILLVTSTPAGGEQHFQFPGGRVDCGDGG